MQSSVGAKLLLAAAGLLASFAFPIQAASAYPDRPVRLIVPFQPGGASDFVARIMQPKLASELGQNIVIENRTGASGYVGIEAASEAPPDGYALLLGNIGTMAINPSVYPKFKVKPLDAFIGVSEVVDVPSGIAVHPSLPVHSLKELIAFAKARPGQLNFAAAGVSSNSTLMFQYLQREIGFKVVRVAYKGGAGGAAIGAATGEVEIAVLSTPALLPFVRSGKLRLLSVIAAKRLSAVPNVPTMPELGYPELKVGSWQGVFVPKGTPRAVVTRLFPAVVNTMKDPEAVRRLATADAVAITSESPEDFRTFWVNEDKRWSKIVKDIGVVQK